MIEYLYVLTSLVVESIYAEIFALTKTWSPNWISYINNLPCLLSLYCSGDVEHTHLVKGLDYALLNKVRSEIKKPDAGDDGDGKPRWLSQNCL